MNDPRNELEKLIDTLDDFVLALNQLKKLLLPMLDLFPTLSAQTKKTNNRGYYHE